MKIRHLKPITSQNRFFFKLQFLGTLTIFLLLIGCNGCRGLKNGIELSESKNEDSIFLSTAKNHDQNIPYITDFSWKEVDKNYLITFPSGKIINTDDFNPFLSQIPLNAIQYDFNIEENKYYYRTAKIDFTKIDRKTKKALTKNMHFEFPVDVDSILYADYRLDFLSDTSIVMPDRPSIAERLILYARCWKNCHEGEHSMEIIVGSMGYTAWFDKQGNMLADFYGDKFGVGQVSSDFKFMGGAVGGYYSDGGGFYRKTRIYIYDLKSKEIVFHKLIDFGKDINFNYEQPLNKWSLFVFDNEKNLRNYIDIEKKLFYTFNRNKLGQKKWIKSDITGYHYEDGSSILFDRDFEKMPLDKLSTPYTSSKN